MNVCKVSKLAKLNCKQNHLFCLQDSVLRITRCVYRAVEKLSERRRKLSEPLMKKDNFDFRAENDFFHVECYT